MLLQHKIVIIPAIKYNSIVSYIFHSEKYFTYLFYISAFLYNNSCKTLPPLLSILVVTASLFTHITKDQKNHSTNQKRFEISLPKP